MPDPTDPRAVADDPSGIVQQMPEVATEVLADLRASITPGPWVAGHSPWPEQIGCCPLVGRPYSIHHEMRNVAAATTVDIARAIALLPDLLDEVIANRARRATEADLRAEVERLRSALKPFASAWRIARASGLTSMMQLGQLARNEVAAVSFLRASAALSPETDGGHDA